MHNRIFLIVPNWIFWEFLPRSIKCKTMAHAHIIPQSSLNGNGPCGGNAWCSNPKVACNLTYQRISCKLDCTVDRSLAHMLSNITRQMQIKSRWSAWLPLFGNLLWMFRDWQMLHWNRISMWSQSRATLNFSLLSSSIVASSTRDPSRLIADNTGNLSFSDCT